MKVIRYYYAIVIFLCNNVTLKNSIFYDIISTFTPMRLSAFILNCLMLTMIFFPCRDHRSVASGISRGQEVYASSHQGGQTDDDCSPLCSCSCCSSVSANVYFPYVIKVTSEPAAKKFPVYNTPEYSAERSSVWQPPRIG